MSSSPFRSVTAEFSQFAASMIASTLDAVITAQLDQEQKIRELAGLAELEVADFAATVIPVERATSELCRLFPTTAGGTSHAASVGSPYVARQAGVEENPAILDLVGYAMVDKVDWDSTSKITQTGAIRILEQVRLRLAETHLLNLRSMLQRGITRVVVDHGRVNAKLNFSLIENTEASGAVPAAATSVVDHSAAGLAAKPQPIRKALTNFKLQVKPVDPRRPEESRATTNMFGEVEITFKTITD